MHVAARHSIKFAPLLEARLWVRLSWFSEFAVTYSTLFLAVHAGCVLDYCAESYAIVDEDSLSLALSISRCHSLPISSLPISFSRGRMRLMQVCLQRSLNGACVKFGVGDTTEEVGGYGGQQEEEEDDDETRCFENWTCR